MRWNLVVCLVLARVAAASQYVVATSGLDSNDGSAANPWLTLQHAADQVVAGDTVTVMAGTYRGFSLGYDTPQDGTANAPITFKAMPGVKINQANVNTSDGINLEGSSYVVIDGFEVSGTGRAGIRSVSNGTTNATHVTIRNNNCHDNQTWGIFTSHVDNLLIQNNIGANSKDQHGIYVSNACVNPHVVGNTLFGNTACGLHMNGDASQGGTGVITGALVEKNFIHDNGAPNGGSGINCDGVQSSRFQNNIVFAEHASGMSLYQQDAAAPAMNNVVVNNTFVVASDGRWAFNAKDGSTGNTAYNNIFLNLNTGHGSIDITSDSLSGLVSDYNVVVDRFTPDDNNFVTLAQWRTQTGQDMHSVISTSAALFVGTADFHLLAGAPAIGLGTTIDAPSDDFDGNARSGAIDVGAFQHCTGACVPADGGTGGGSAGTGGGSAGVGGGAAATGGGAAATGGGAAATGGGSAATGGGSAATGGGSAAMGGGSAAMGGGSAATGGGAAATGGGSAGTGGGTAGTGGGSTMTTGGCSCDTTPGALLLLGLPFLLSGAQRRRRLKRRGQRC